MFRYLLYALRPDGGRERRAVSAVDSAAAVASVESAGLRVTALVCLGA